MSTIKKYTGVVIGLYGFVLTSIAFAQVTLLNPLGTSSFQVVLNEFNTFLLAIAAPICGIMVVYGGFQMITAAGNPERFSSGKKTLLYAAIALSS